jgi:hypothetical protein
MIAEQKALDIGIDSLALPGSWHSPATTSQKRTLREHAVPFRPDISKREAGDLIALSFVKQSLQQFGIRARQTKSRSVRSAG